MKYIMFKTTQPDSLIPIVFPAILTHSDVAQSMSHLLKHKSHYRSVEIRSAGFVNSNWECTGESTSIGVKSHEADTSIMQTYDISRGYS